MPFARSFPLRPRKASPAPLDRRISRFLFLPALMAHTQYNVLSSCPHSRLPGSWNHPPTHRYRLMCHVASSCSLATHIYLHGRTIFLGLFPFGYKNLVFCRMSTLTHEVFTKHTAPPLPSIYFAVPIFEAPHILTFVSSLVSSIFPNIVPFYTGQDGIS